MHSNIAKISKVIKTDDWEMYFENPTVDYFNLYKDNIKLIISRKKGDFLRHVPDHYWPADTVWYALIRGYNCQWRCHYCYLQSYFKSPDIVRFFNTEDLVSFLEKFLDKFFSVYPTKKIILYDWDFQDSFWYAFLEQNLKQLSSILSLISKYNNVFLEVRTKQIVQDFKKYDLILQDKFSKNLIVAITFSPDVIVKNFEWWTADLDLRVSFAKYVQNKGFKLGLRIDPIILLYEDFEKSVKLYKEMIELLKSQLDEKLIFNRWIWILRFKKSLYKKLKEVDSLLIKKMVYDNWFYRYPLEVRKQIYSVFKNLIWEKLYICMDDIL